MLMNRMLSVVATIAAVVLAAGTAQAQSSPPNGGAPPGPGLTPENPAVRNPGDTYDSDMARERDAAVSAARKKTQARKVARTVPATPEDVIAGKTVRDAKGIAVGTIESVNVSGAVLVTGAGKVEVPLEAFGKDSKGLMLGMAKSDFDAAVIAANKPAG